QAGRGDLQLVRPFEVRFGVVQAGQTSGDLGYPVQVQAFPLDRDLQGSPAPAPDQLEIVELPPLGGQVFVGDLPQVGLYAHLRFFSVLRRHGSAGIHSNKVGQTPTSCEKTGSVGRYRLYRSVSPTRNGTEAFRTGCLRRIPP